MTSPKLREEITAATNKAEAYNGFSAWLMFGNEVITRNDPACRPPRWMSTTPSRCMTTVRMRDRVS